MKTSISYSNISDFWYIRQLMDDGSFEQALQENQNLIAENTLEENLQFINNVYLEYIVNDAEIPPHIEAGLWDLAGLTPWIGGSAVYTARIILGYDPDEHGVPYRLKDSTRVFAKSQNVLVFPNPANEIVTLRFDNITQDKEDFILYDYTGKAVLVTTIPAGTKEYIINTERVKPGLLLYSIRAGSKTFSGKIIKL